MGALSHADTCGCQLEAVPAEGGAVPAGQGGALRRAVEHAAHYLPQQGPIGVFVHHNTLHAFQGMEFEKAVVAAAARFKAEPFLAEDVYQKERATGRIREEDVDAVLAQEPDAELLPGRLTRRQLRRAMLIPGVRRVNGLDLTWQMEEGNWLKAFRSDLPAEARKGLAGDRPAALWQVCLSRCRKPAPAAARQPVRPAEAVQTRCAVELDLVVHAPLIRLVGAYLDQGVAYWPMPLREAGLLSAARRIMAQPVSVHQPHLSGLRAEFLRQESGQMSAEAVVLDALARLGVPEEEWEEFLTAELLALPGWAGMVRVLEKDATLAPHDRVRCSLLEFLALRLTYTWVAVQELLGSASAWREILVKPLKVDVLTPVARFYDVAQLVGLASQELARLPGEQFEALAQEIAACHEVERRLLLHLAYERRHERRVLIPLAKHRRLPRAEPESDRLAAQVFFCVDEREESMRRALEEVDPSVETVGAVGFFGVAIDYTGLDDASGSPLCPVLVKPGHAVREVPVDRQYHLHSKRQSLRRGWATLARNGFISSRTLVRGWVSTAFLGFFTVFPLVLRVLSPRSYGKFIKRLNRAFLPEPKTEITFMRQDDASRDATTGLLHGFTEHEMAERVHSILAPAGLNKAHARLVLLLGHGSTSLNNPYESAYCCGACGGRSGGPNARVFAIMANRPGVRAVLKGRGITIPEDTWFLGGSHDTCSDDIEVFDLGLMPESHRADYHRLRMSLDKARVLNADERVRRFGTAGAGVRGERALRHVQARAEHLAEPRPEYGHATNAVAYVGRREFTRGLFLDRRSFLISYDPTQDATDAMLGRLLSAAIPVCGGINLEYYFSTVDNEVYGSGTKLPHNITGLVGVMNGFQGDLRTGLPVQTVEIHEPVRILFIVETTPARLMKVVKASRELSEFVCNRWIRVATLDPVDGHVEVYRGGEVFEPLTGDEEPLPIIPNSRTWYRGKREHLPLARIEPAKGRAA